jgi:AcrR family transcriptional regulator
MIKVMNERAEQPPRQRILDAAAQLLAEGGREAVSTRAVSAVAGVQAQTIYRQFGDMRGLMDAVAAAGWAAYIAAKTSQEHGDDPVEELRSGWDLHVEFGLAHPGIYKMTYGDPRPGAPSAVSGEAHDFLTGIIKRIAAAGRLRVSVEAAAAMIHTAGVGATLGLIAAQLDHQLPAHATLSHDLRDAVFAAILIPGSSDDDHAAADGGPSAASRAVALKAVLAQADERFSASEASLLREWLDRISTPRPS